MTLLLNKNNACGYYVQPCIDGGGKNTLEIPKPPAISTYPQARLRDHVRLPRLQHDKGMEHGQDNGRCRRKAPRWYLTREMVTCIHSDMLVKCSVVTALNGVVLSSTAERSTISTRVRTRSISINAGSRLWIPRRSSTPISLPVPFRYPLTPHSVVATLPSIRTAAARPSLAIVDSVPITVTVARAIAITFSE